MRRRTGGWIVAAGIAVAASSPAHGATCEWSQRFATDVVSLGSKASLSDNDMEAKRAASNARFAAVDGGNEAKSCGCPAALAHFEEAAHQASFADRAANLTAINQYGSRVKASGQKALDALQRCSGG